MLQKTIAIAYICTGPYTYLFEDFYNTFNKCFCKECNVTFFVFTDKPEITKHLSNCITYNIEHHENLSRTWLLFRKFKYLMYAENKFVQYDYVCFANSNIRCLQNVTLKELIGNYKYAACTHSYDSSMNFRSINKTYYTYTNAQYTASIKRPYVLATFILAKARSFLKLANTIEGWRCLDKACGLDQYVVNHDEAYFNRYVEEHMHEFNILNGKQYLCWETNFPDVENARKMILASKAKVFQKHSEKLQSNNTKDLYLLNDND